MSIHELRDTDPNAPNCDICGALMMRPDNDSMVYKCLSCGRHLYRFSAAVIAQEIEEYCKLEPCSDHHCPCGGAGHYVTSVL